MSGENRICDECVLDAFLRKEISKSSIIDEECSYCQRIKPTIDLWNLAQRCNAVIQDFYTLSSDTDAVLIYNHDPQGKPFPKLLEELLGCSSTIVDDLATLIFDDLWFDRDSFERSYSNDDDDVNDIWFVRTESSPQPLSKAWNQMERSLKNEARFFNPLVGSTLEAIFGAISTDKTVDGTPVIAEIGPNTAINTIYRARVFQRVDTLESAMRHPEKALGAPPPASAMR